MDIIDNREDGKDAIEQSRLVMVRLLRILDTICDEYHLTYWLSSGTLLGAVRHNGFIPWDDDIDVEMPRKDYDEFIRIAQSVLPDDVFLQTRETDRKYPLLYAKLRDKYSTFEERDFKCACHQGIFIDIFPIEYSRYPRCQRIVKVFTHGSCYSSLTGVENFIQHWIGRIVKKCIVIFRIPFYDWLNRLFRTSFAKAACYSFGMEIQDIKTFPLKCLFPLKKLQFEEYKFNVPYDYDQVLTLMYGDYMKLPPMEERISHNTGIYPFRSCCHKEIREWKK